MVAYKPGKTRSLSLSLSGVFASASVRVPLQARHGRPRGGRREALGPNGQLVAFRLGTNGSIIYCKRLPVVRVFLPEERGTGTLGDFGGRRERGSA